MEKDYQKSSKNLTSFFFSNWLCNELWIPKEGTKFIFAMNLSLLNNSRRHFRSEQLNISWQDLVFLIVAESFQTNLSEKSKAWTSKNKFLWWIFFKVSGGRLNTLFFKKYWFLVRRDWFWSWACSLKFLINTCEVFLFK